jgi:hypothetical protein
MEFTTEQIAEIERLAAIPYDIWKVAICLDIPKELLYKEYEDRDSQFHYHYTRGFLLQRAILDMKTLNDAKEGNLTALAIYHKVSEKNKLDNLKAIYFGL